MGEGRNQDVRRIQVKQEVEWAAERTQGKDRQRGKGTSGSGEEREVSGISAGKGERSAEGDIGEERAWKGNREMEEGNGAGVVETGQLGEGR